MTPFNFSGDQGACAGELARFEKEAARFKPPALDQEYALRLDYFLHRQHADVLETLKKRYPRTWQDVAACMETLPVTRFFVSELSKVFLNGASVHLVDEETGEALEADDERAQAWAEVVEEAALSLKLKQVDRYTTLMRTCFLVFDRAADGALTAQIFLPQLVDVVFDDAHPFDLDMAWGVRLRIGGATPGPDGKERARYAFWCARPGCAQYRVIWSDGLVEPVPGNEKGEVPYQDEAGRPLVPVVMFTAHTEELGAFTNASQGLHLFNRSIDVMVTDVHFGGLAQYFGQLVITYPQGMEPSKQATYEVGPTRALELKDGATAAVLAPSPQIAQMVDLLDKDLKRQAVLHGLPAGSISLEARAVASGVALQIEMRPLMEARTDSVEVYRRPMKRLWSVARAVYDAREVAPVFKGVCGRWQPGEIQMPESEDALIDRLMLLRRAGWMGDVRAVMRIFKVDEEEAERLLAEAKAGTPEVEPEDPEKDPGQTPADPPEGDEEPEETEDPEGDPPPAQG